MEGPDWITSPIDRVLCCNGAREIFGRVMDYLIYFKARREKETIERTT